MPTPHTRQPGFDGAREYQLFTLRLHQRHQARVEAKRQKRRREHAWAALTLPAPQCPCADCRAARVQLAARLGVESWQL